MRVIKINRMNIDTAGKLLQKHPNIKIIHYIRDPRGTLLSRTVNYEMLNNDPEKDVKLLCKKMLYNVMKFKEVEKQNPGCCLQIKYEDLASNPLKVGEKLLQFTGMEVTKDYLSTWISKHTSAKRDNGNYATERKNSTYTAVKWKLQLSRKLISYADQVCADVYSEIGYDSFHHHE